MKEKTPVDDSDELLTVEDEFVKFLMREVIADSIQDMVVSMYNEHVRLYNQKRSNALH